MKLTEYRANFCYSSLFSEARNYLTSNIVIGESYGNHKALQSNSQGC